MDDTAKAHGLNEKAQYLIIGNEVGKEEQTPHLQGYVRMKNQITMKVLKRKYLPRAHLEIAKGTDEQNRTYCSKDGEYKEYGTMKKQGRRTDLDEVKELIETGENKMRNIIEVCKSYQSVRMAETLLKYKEKKRTWKPYVKWIYGPTGTGKSYKAHNELEDPYVCMETNKWWDGYDGHDNVIIDDMRKDFCKFHVLLRILDRYGKRIECKGGSRQLLAKKIYITSCYHPEVMYDTREDIDQLLDRIDVIEHMTGESRRKKPGEQKNMAEWCEAIAEGNVYPFE